jgi:hypothetical protein
LIGNGRGEARRWRVLTGVPTRRVGTRLGLDFLPVYAAREDVVNLRASPIDPGNENQYSQPPDTESREPVMISGLS